MRLVTDRADASDGNPDLDFRDEVLGRIYDQWQRQHPSAR